MLLLCLVVGEFSGEASNRHTACVKLQNFIALPPTFDAHFRLSCDEASDFSRKKEKLFHPFCRSSAARAEDDEYVICISKHTHTHTHTDATVISVIIIIIIIQWKTFKGHKKGIFANVGKCCDIEKRFSIKQGSKKRIFIQHVRYIETRMIFLAVELLLLVFVDVAM